VALAATLQSDITHASREARAASVAVSGLVAAVLRGQSGPGRDQLVLASGGDDPQIDEVFAQLDRLVKAEPSAALAAIVSRTPGRELSDGLPDEAIATLLWSIYGAVRSDWDYARAMAIVISGGGEMTAAAAIAGALCGAARGIDTLPRPLIAHVSNQGVEGLAQLVELADQCQRLAGDVCRPA
jgi:ADP-ribosylglycohydrolase